MTTETLTQTEKARGVYRAVWRWHFYAGLFCIPFVIWLSITGSIFLFKPQIERWLDRPYDHLHLEGTRTAPHDQVRVALAAMPGTSLHFYELPRTNDAAARVVVGKGRQEYRVYINPVSLAVLHIVNEDRRPMNVLQRLHGELLMGDRGSLVVELAASWAIVMVLTGLYLWWPRQAATFAGVFYVRLRHGRRLMWRDLHAVTGVWVSAFALFLLFTGLPWAKSWSGYLQKARTLTSAHAGRPDWSTGRSAQLADRMALNHEGMAGMGGPVQVNVTPADLAQNRAQLDTVVRSVAPLGLAWPVLIMPPAKPGAAWKARSDAQNRPLRSTVTVDGTSGAVLTRESFQQRGWIDRAVGTGVAAHEGQLFGWFNQLLGLLTAMGLILLCVSAVALWWRRRAVGVLGAPLPLATPRFSLVLVIAIVLVGIYLPLFGLSLLAVWAVERTLLRRVPFVCHWLGLVPVH